MKARITMYEHAHRRQPSVVAIAQMLSTMLYNKRFFPYYTFNVLVGLDDEGKGAVYHYDAIGSFERVPYTTSGSGSSLVMSVLDAQIAQNNQLVKSAETPSMQEVVELSKDCLSSVGERDIFTGDAMEIFLVTEGGVTMHKFDLKKD
jgi:20S proteasome subunit beta 6